MIFDKLNFPRKLLWTGLFAFQQDSNEPNAILDEQNNYVLLLKEHLFEGQEKLSSARKITSRKKRRFKKKRKTLSSLIQMSKKI